VRILVACCAIRQSDYESRARIARPMPFLHVQAFQFAVYGFPNYLTVMPASATF
jgi:hypothetical protein